MNRYKSFSNIDIIRDMTFMDDIFMTVMFESQPECIEDVLKIILSFEPVVESVETQQ